MSNIDSPLTNTSLADPDLRRLPIQDCDLEEPPELVVWLISRITRASVSSLFGLGKRCSICKRPMCDYHYLRKQMMNSKKEAPAKKSPIHPSQSTTAPPAANPPPVADKAQPTAGDPLPPTISARSGNVPKTQRQPPATSEIEHTCDRLPPIRCELPIKVKSSGCGHYIGHACLEKWIMDGRRQCPVCRTVWFKKAKNRRQTLRESYSWWTPACLLGVGDVEVDKTYQGTRDSAAIPWGGQNAGDGTEGNAVEEAKADT
ncbi:Nn.00g032630.m01.CDS01 [Neocucurbitaria sp. VM-36]